MRVELRLFATLADRVTGARAGEPLSVELPDGVTLGALVSQLGLSIEEVHLAIVNGRVVQGFTMRLGKGDRVGLFPPIGGG